MIVDFIPVCRPLLPAADSIAAYIVQIDGCRHYTNRGPLVGALEQRLAQAMALPDGAVRSASSGTSAIEIAILANAGIARPDRPIALMPSFTFAASAVAVERCGYQPCFVDVDPAHWTLDPDTILHHPLLARAGLILAVGPYGRLPDMRALEALQARAGVPVVVDAAAAFEQVLDHPAQISATVPITISFHATKTFSTGEGGAVLWRNDEGQDRVVQAANFGFLNSREARQAGVNAKLSEYHAAVGLAMLDGFATRRTDYARVSGLYRDLARDRDLGGTLHLPPDISSAYVLLETDTALGMQHAKQALHGQMIETRRWYEAGVHVQTHFAARAANLLPVNPLPVTKDLCQRLLGLPMAPDMTAGAIARTLDVLATAHQSVAQPAAAQARR